MALKTLVLEVGIYGSSRQITVHCGGCDRMAAGLGGTLSPAIGLLV
jgi:hypothetical protein